MELVSDYTENQTPERTPVFFYGKGSKYFGIVIVNAILTIITLGLYYPWAKANVRKFLWNETEVKDSRLVFHGTGMEMFKGFIISYVILVTLYAGLIWSHENREYALYFVLGFYLALALIIPLAIFGAWRYRITRTSWRGVYLQFDGKLRVFLKLYVKHILLTIITLGIYFPWFRVEVMKYLFGHTIIGKNRLEFRGSGSDLFVINLLGSILTVVTLYMYLPVYLKERINFTINNTWLNNGELSQRFRSKLRGRRAWVVMVTNVLLVIFTLGIGFAWATMRYLKMVLESIEIPANLDFDNLEQSEKGPADATGDEMLDILDVGLDF